MKSNLEYVLMKRCQEEAKKHGYLLLILGEQYSKQKGYFNPNGAGFPDTVLINPNEYGVVFIEFKYGKGKLSKIQNEKIEALREDGNRVEVVYSMDEFLEIFKEY